MSINVTSSETLNFDGKSHTIRGLNCSDFCYQYWLPCYPWVDYQADSANERLQYFSDCVCLPICCFNKDWQVRRIPEGVDRETVPVMSGVQGASCCENGCLYRICPMLTCGGNAVTQKIYAGENDSNVIATMRHDMWPCWALGLGITFSWGIMGICCCDVWNWCCNTPYVVTTENLYPPEAGLGKDVKIADSQPIGKIKTAEMIECVSCPLMCWCCCCPCFAPICYTYRKMIKYGVTIDTGSPDADKAATAAAALIAMIWAGAIRTPCSCCVMPPVSKPCGHCSVDGGRAVTATRGTIEDMMRAYGEDAPPLVAPGAIAAQVEMSNMPPGTAVPATKTGDDDQRGICA